ncbi:tetratricopeptide repeat protein [Nocardiopsis sp. CA-288880]|uniref:tetratricopeptide repeat protein n=1 Tax=Nocardiopsis sp. CA-288880 TaxID=3239995 RepID=UPI003D97ECF4
MSRSRKVACAVTVTVLLGTVVGAGLWWGGGVFSRQGWEATSWVAAVAGFLLAGAPVWVWALRREESTPAPAPVPPGAQVDSSVAGDVTGVAVQGGAFLSPVTIYQGEREATSTVSAWSAPVTEVDLYQVGVHRSRSVNGPEGPGVVTAYADRDIDKDLRSRVAAAGRDGGLVLVVGGSAAGKTRAAWQAVATQLPDHRLLVPNAGADLAHLPERVRAEAVGCAGVVVWLDDMDRHLNTGRNLTAALIHTLTQERVVVVATLRQGPYDTYRSTTPTGQGGAEELARIQTGQDLVRGVEAVRVERVWTPDELANGTRIAAERGDMVLADAVARQLRGLTDGAAEHGVAEYLAAAPELVALWQHARDSLGSEGGHPRGHRLVAASVDLARIGVGSADARLLEAAHAHYPLPASSRPESFARALEWAGAVRFGASGLLIPTTTTDNTRWRPFDYLLDTATPVPDPLWDTALTHTTDEAGLFSIGLAASRVGLTAIAETAWTRAAEADNTFAMVNLGFLLWGRGEDEEAETLWRRAAEAGETRAMVNLGLLFKGRGEDEEAETWYLRATAAGDTRAMVNLGLLLEDWGEEEEAETWYRRGAEAGDTNAMVGLGFLLSGRGEDEEAETLWRRGAEAGDTFAMVNLGLLLEDRGEEEAETWYRRGAEAGHARAMVKLELLLKERGEEEEAEVWQRRAAETEATNLVPPRTGQRGS